MNIEKIIVDLMIIGVILGFLGYFYYFVLKLRKGDSDENESNRCLNCGGEISKVNLFCPWCHCDLREGGKNGKK